MIKIAERLQQVEEYYFSRKLEDIRTELIERFKQQRIMKGGSLKPGTINRDVGRIRAIFNKAIAWGYLKENPVV